MMFPTPPAASYLGQLEGWGRQEFEQLYAQLAEWFNGLGQWTSYTPVWTTTGTAPTRGNATLTGRYLKIDQTVWYDLAFTFGSTSAVGSGPFRFSLPFTASNTTFGAHAARILDSGTQHYVCVGYLPTATTVAVLNNGNTASGVGDAVPMTWAAGDTLHVSGWYTTA